MSRKTVAERDLLNTRLRINSARSRVKRVKVLNEWAKAYLGQEIPTELLHALGHAEYAHGFTAGVRDASGEDD